MSRWSVLVVVVAIAAMTMPAGAQVQDPSLTTARRSAAPGEDVTVRLRNWPERVVVIAVCGNDAARGAADCNMARAVAVGIGDLAGVTASDVEIAAPPVPCPCVLRATTPNHEHVTLVPFEVIGAPVGPVVQPTMGPMVDLRIDVGTRRSSIVPALRASLGGPRTFDVEVEVANRAAEPVTLAGVAGVVGRSADEIRTSFAVRELPTLAPGDRWTGTARVRVPGPLLGRVHWRVTAAGAGPVVQAHRETRFVPIALVLATGSLAGAIVAWLRRRALRPRVPSRLDSGTTAPGRALPLARLAGGATADVIVDQSE